VSTRGVPLSNPGKERPPAPLLQRTDPAAPASNKSLFGSWGSEGSQIFSTVLTDPRSRKYSKMKNFHKKFQLVFLEKLWVQFLWLPKLPKFWLLLGGGLLFYHKNGKQDCLFAKILWTSQTDDDTQKMRSYMKKPQSV
jgi:hypothetical protein